MDCLEYENDSGYENDEMVGEELEVPRPENESDHEEHEVQQRENEFENEELEVRPLGNEPGLFIKLSINFINEEHEVQFRLKNK